MNRRFSLAAALVLAFASFGSMAHAGGWMVGAHAGASIPTGDFADENKGNADTGWQFGGDLDYTLSNTWRLGLDGNWNKNSSGFEGTTVPGVGTYDEANINQWNLGAHANYMIPTSGSFHPYGLVGLGLYNPTAHTKITSGGVSTENDIDQGSRFGGKVGLGGDWSMNQTMSVGAEAAYNMVSLDEAKSSFSSMQYVGLQVGIKYNLQSAK